MATRMNDNFDKYWGNVEKMNMLLYIAFVLDPRKKLEFVRFCFLEMYDAEQSLVMINNVKKAIEDLFNEYKKRLQPSFEQVGISSNMSQIIEVDALDLEKERQLFFSKFKRYKKEIDREKNKSELDRDRKSVV